ncbi:MAG: ABC transporter ATP-binding protein [Actinobacteria bacterium]|nr:ABC transporter ATP-binding protein [Actinomycetota bacterium]
MNQPSPTLQTSTSKTGLAALGLQPVPGAPLLELDDLRTYFEIGAGTVHAVDGVSLKVDRAMTLGVVGESGSGKTVLSRSAMGLLRSGNLRQSGQVRYQGHDLIAMADKTRRRLWGTEMAMVFQDPMTSLNPVMKIGRQITESLRYHLGMSKSEAREAALVGLKSVGIPAPEQRIDEYPHQLSGGMRQRVTIAVALACGPKLLFADEPTTALDVTVQAQILDLLDHQRRERNMGMILVTHDLGVVAGRADVVAVMYAGQVVEIAPTAELFGNVRMPYTEALLRAIPKLDEASHTKLNVISGRPPDLIKPPKGCRFAPRCPYAQSKCRNEPPPLVESSTPGHAYRCWFPVGSDQGSTQLPAPVVREPAPDPAPDGAPKIQPTPPPKAPERRITAVERSENAPENPNE